MSPVCLYSQFHNRAYKLLNIFLAHFGALIGGMYISWCLMVHQLKFSKHILPYLKVVLVLGSSLLILAEILHQQTASRNVQDRGLEYEGFSSYNTENAHKEL